MNRFRYQARTANGTIVSAEVDAKSVSEALIELEKQGLAVLSIEVVSPEKVAADAERAVFYGELQRMLECRSDWLPQLQSFTVELPHGRVRRQLEKQVQVVCRIATAQEFIEQRDAIALLPMIMPRFHSNRALQAKPNWLVQSSKRLESRSRYLSAFIYPIVLFALAVLAFVLLSIFVFPTFRSLFEEIRLRVPKSTGTVFWISDQLTRYAARTFIYCSLGGLLAIALIYLWRSHAFTNRIFGRLVSGRTSNLLAMSTLIGTLADLLELKSPLGLALSIAGRHCNHPFYRHATDCLAEYAHSGIVSEIPPQSKKRLPPLLLHALRPNESGRPHLPMLHELASLYDDRARYRSDWTIAGGPNVAIFLVGMFILWIVLALCLPLVELITTMSR